MHEHSMNRFGHSSFKPMKTHVLYAMVYGFGGHWINMIGICHLDHDLDIADKLNHTAQNQCT